ncbi:hypothetical protein [Paraburkholderia sacchari]|uniref:hypothetical protein n=1 Tax=Paraburkholderia sacchari TaxID=159450 RepID=UPI000543BC9D|nr:hypothetical protein [Paraburkholderia sacchari]NLP64966.1 hypothetical protein [Paraburkholderia sacchari]
MLRKFRIDVLSVLILVVLPGLLIWFRGDSWLGLHSAEKRAGWIVALCIVFVLLFLWFSFDASSRPAVAARRVRYWVLQQLNLSSGQPDDATSAERTRAAALRSGLRDRHGWRWNYRERWIVIAGDTPLVKRIAPGLTEKGYAFTGDIVLLHATQTTDTLETEWLGQIRRLRRRCPVDAIVAVARAHDGPRMRAEADRLAQRLARHARALRWAAPVYLLNATEFDEGDPTIPDDPIGFTWSAPRVHEEDVDRSLRSLSHNLADAGVARLINSHADRYPALLSRHIDERRTDLIALVAQIAQSRYWRHAVHGLVFAPLFRAREAAGTRPPVTASSGVCSRIWRRTFFR